MYRTDFQKLQSKSVSTDSSSVVKEGSKFEPLKLRRVENPQNFVVNQVVCYKPLMNGLRPRQPVNILQPNNIIPPTDKFHYINSNYIRHREISGKILGAPKKRYAEHSVVPNSGIFNDSSMQFDSTSLSSLNASSDWITCFDDEAGASYYYNQVTGEASWLNPQNNS